MTALILFMVGLPQDATAMTARKIREGTGGTFRFTFESKADTKRARQIIEQIGFSTKS